GFGGLPLHEVFGAGGEPGRAGVGSVRGDDELVGVEELFVALVGADVAALVGVAAELVGGGGHRARGVGGLGLDADKGDAVDEQEQVGDDPVGSGGSGLVQDEDTHVRE